MSRRARRLVVAFLPVALVGATVSGPAAVVAVVPTAVADSFTVQKNDGAIALDVLANDTHDSSTSGIVTPSNPPHGVVVVDADGQGLTYDPDQTYTGSDSFTYTIHDQADGDSTATVTIKVNAPPVAVDDPGTACQPPAAFGGAFPIVEDHGEFLLGGACGLFPNDTDSDGTIVDWEPVSQPSHGQLAYVDPSLFTYTPDADYSTIAGDMPGGQWISDSFTYRVKDDDGAWSQPATWRVWMAPINDPPTFITVPEVEVAEDSGAYDVSWAPYVSAGPPNEAHQTVTFQITSGESHGVVNLFSVPPTFTTDGHLTFTPGPNEHGYALITGFLQDNGGIEDYGPGPLPVPPDDTGDEVTFLITVSPVDDAPVAAPDSVTVAEDSGATTVLVRANDSDVEGDTLTVTSKTNGAKGAVAINGSNTAVTYTPNANANGSDSFTYTISDGHGATDTATVNVTITPVNDPPLAANDGSPTPIKIGTGAGPVPIAVLANDTSGLDAPEILRIVAVTQGSSGTVAIIDQGTRVSYDPTGSATGIDTFSYTISDGHGGADTATVQVQVGTDTTAPVTTAPVVAVSRLTRPATARLAVTWTAVDPESGVSSLLQVRRDGGAWTTVTLIDPTVPRAILRVPTGHTYQFQVRATNGVGTVTPFKVGALVAV